MAEGTPNIGDLLNMFSGANPISGIGKTIDQFKRGVNDFLTAVETFNRTMDTMNGVATRVSRLLDDVEEPVRAVMPQVTKAVNAAQGLVDQLTDPIERVAPTLSNLANTLSAPSISNLPDQMGDFLDVLSDLGRRLKPLSDLAETAGGMFGLRGLSKLAAGARQGVMGEPVVASPAAASASSVADVPVAAAAPSKATKAAPAKAAPKKAAPATATAKPVAKTTKTAAKPATPGSSAGAPGKKQAAAQAKVTSTKSAGKPAAKRSKS